MTTMPNHFPKPSSTESDGVHVVLIESYMGDGDMRFLGRCGSCSGHRSLATRATSREEAELLRGLYLESFGDERVTVVHPDDPCLDNAAFRRQLLEHAQLAH